MLIGRHGQTIDAMQYLANAIKHRAFPAEERDVVVDAAGYRERRPPSGQPRRVKRKKKARR